MPETCILMPETFDLKPVTCSAYAVVLSYTVKIYLVIDIRLAETFTPMSNTDSGHRKNVFLFEALVSFVRSLGPRYNPGNNYLRLDNLEMILAASKTALDEWYSAASNYAIATSHKNAMRTGAPTMITRILRQIRSMDLNQEIVEDAKQISRFFRPVPIRQKDSTMGAMYAGPKTRNYKSYNKVLDNATRMVSLVHKIPSYSINHDELSKAGLQAWLDALHTAGTNAEKAHTQLYLARAERDRLLYSDEGMIETARKVKSHLRAVYGYNNPLIKQISSFQFK